MINDLEVVARAVERTNSSGWARSLLETSRRSRDGLGCNGGAEGEARDEGNRWFGHGAFGGESKQTGKWASLTTLTEERAKTYILERRNRGAGGLLDLHLNRVTDHDAGCIEHNGVCEQ